MGQAASCWCLMMMGWVGVVEAGVVFQGTEREGETEEGGSFPDSQLPGHIQRLTHQ